MAKEVKTNHIDRKFFNYEKGAVTLQFNLRVDTNSELMDFNEILEKAKKDVEVELKKVNKN